MTSFVFRCAFAIAPVIAAMFLMAEPSDAAQPALHFMNKTYTLGSYNQKSENRGMWEFVTAGENVDDWATLMTVIDRPDAANMVDLDRLAEGTMDQFKSGGAKVLMAKTMHDPNGKAYDYMVAAFNEPDKHRYELNFIKIAMGPKNAYTQIFAVRITGADYPQKAAKYLDEHSGAVGKALAEASTPNVAGWPRTTF